MLDEFDNNESPHINSHKLSDSNTAQISNNKDAEIADTVKLAPAIKEIGEVIGERYQVLAHLDTLDQSIEITYPEISGSPRFSKRLYNVYSVKPTQGYRCWACGSEDFEAPDESFCDHCGVELAAQPLRLVEAFSFEEFSPSKLIEAFAESDCRYGFLLEESTVSPEVFTPNSITRLSYGYKTDIGRVRETDQDSLLLLVLSNALEASERTIALFAVADGMGGHEGGEIASKLTLQVISEILFNELFIPLLQEEAKVVLEEWVLDRIAQAVRAASNKVNEEGHRLGHTDEKGGLYMGSTLTLALVIDDTAYIANVGDSRTYILDNEGLNRITTDHSWVELEVSRGKLKPEEVYTHPRRNLITRSIGDLNLEIDTFVQQLKPGDYLLLCCDGLWEMIQNPLEITGVIEESESPQVACEELVERANDYGGTDNISVIVVQLELLTAFRKLQ